MKFQSGLASKTIKNPVPMGKRDILHFTIPVVIDNFATTSIGLLYSALVGKISSSALAAVGLANSTINVLISACAVLTTGSAILMARHVGAADREEASRTIEQSIFFYRCNVWTDRTYYHCSGQPNYAPVDPHRRFFHF